MKNVTILSVQVLITVCCWAPTAFAEAPVAGDVNTDGAGSEAVFFTLDVTLDDTVIKPEVYAALAANGIRTTVGLTVEFLYDAVTADGNDVAQYRWDFNGDGITDLTTLPSTPGPVPYVYASPGAYLPTLMAVDSAGHSTISRWPMYVSDAPTPGETETIMLPGNVPLVMVWIPAGTFMMGRYPGEQDSYSDEDPQHQVTLTHGFWLGKYELTKRQWTAVMGTTRWSGLSYVLNDLDSPAVDVSWDNARALITALNTYTGLTFRLPSEAEWEYAYRAGTPTRFYWGDDATYSQIDNYAWSYGNASDAGESYAHVVGLKLPNARGLYDMSGNVWEWCEHDWHNGYTGAPTNGSAWVDSPSGSSRVLRGGGWNYFGLSCRSAYRNYYDPSSTAYSIGFRLSR